MNNASSDNLTNETFPEENDDYEMYDSCPPLEEEGKLENVARITAYVVIIAISLIGNILIIAVTRRTRSMRKVAFNFVVNMAIADLCTTVINVPESLAVEIRDTDEWFQGNAGVALCKLLPFCQQVCAFCSILSLLAIALDRFFAICMPLKRIMTRRLSMVIIFSTWLIPCISSAPMFVANTVVEEKGLFYCMEKWPAPFDPEKASTDYTIILFVLFYLLPLVIISTLYSCVVSTIWKRKTPGHRSQTANRLYSRSRRKALKMFIAIVVCFTLCWLPYHITFFLVAYNETFYTCGIPEDLYFTSSFFSHAVSALNPCIYVAFNNDYRTGVKRLLATCAGRSNALYPDMNTGTASDINSRTVVNGEQEMTTFHSRSPRSGFRDLLQKRRNTVEASRGDAFVVNQNLGFTE